MILNYFKIAWRNILRYRVFSLINVLGLALGISSCIVIYTITSYDFSFDKFHEDRNRIYRIVGNMQKGTGETEFLNTPFGDVAGFKDQIPGFEAKSGFILYGGSISVPNGNESPKKFDNRISNSYSSTAIITWPQYFDVFKYKWLAGSPQTLNDPYKVVLSEKRAKIYFGDLPLNEMIGKSVIYDDSLKLSVSGIVQDWTGNTDFGYTDFISISSATRSFLKSRIPAEDWTSLYPHNAMAFVKLQKGVTPEQVNSRFAAYIKEHVKLPPGGKLTMFLQSINDIHYSSSFRRSDDGDDFRKAYLPTLYILMGVALFIMIIATVNFINLSTAQSVQRAKEIGVRKVLGGSKKGIMLQFFTETFVLTLFAVFLSILLVKPLLLLFSDYIPDGAVFEPFNPSTLQFLAIITLVTTFLAGFYPARILAGYLPVLNLKGSSLKTGKEKINLRKALIVFQFTISCVFIIGALVMGKQIKFMTSGDKGFNSDAIITINKWRDNTGKLPVLAESIKQIKGVDKVILQGTPPMGFAQMTANYIFKGKEEIHLEPLLKVGNEDYISFYQMKLIAGKNLSHSDTLNEILINETLAKTIGFTDLKDAVGQRLYTMGNQPEKSLPIAGVIADFHQGSFHDAIQPTVIGNVPNYRSIAVKLTTLERNTDAVKSIISQIETRFKEIYPDDNFDYKFLNESISWLYGQDKKSAWIVNAAMLITIFISCMGLFGLGMFTAQRRTKEIGIRKVLGANAGNIVLLLSRDYLVLIFIALVLATPIAWYFSNQWLQDFVFRTNITVELFFVAGICMILIGLITVSFHAIRAAITNPVKSLRTE